MPMIFMAVLLFCLFLFDGGEGTQVSLRRLNLKWKKINAIFVSHTHADHVTGLPGILMLSAQVDRSEPLYIFGPPKIAEYIESSRKVLDMYINYPIVVKEIAAPCVVWFLGKTFAVVWLLMWVRWTFPRLRIDQILKLEWKYLMPLSLIILIMMTVCVAFGIHG